VIQYLKDPKEWILVEGGRKEGQMRSRYFEYIYENRAVKSVKIVLRRRGRGRMMEG
jgi:hypothetical protein